MDGVNLRLVIVTTAIGALVSLVVGSLVRWLTRNNGAAFFHSYKISFNLSIAEVVIVVAVIGIITFLMSRFTSQFNKLIIVDAQYGVNGQRVDITREMTAHIADNQLNLLISNAISGYDPANGIHKNALVKYRYGKKQDQITVAEGERIVLPQYN